MGEEVWVSEIERLRAALESAAATLERTQQRLVQIHSREIDGVNILAAHSDAFTGAKEARAALTPPAPETPPPRQ